MQQHVSQIWFVTFIKCKIPKFLATLQTLMLEKKTQTDLESSEFNEKNVLVYKKVIDVN
jgi:hypothetical protein